MYYGLLLVPSLINVFVIVTFWRSLAKLGFTDEVIKRAPNMLPLDGVAVLLCAMVGYLALHSWTGLSLEFADTAPNSVIGTTLIATICCLTAMGITRYNSGDRFTTPTVVGIKESVVRTLLTLRVIDRAEEILRRRKP